MNLAKHNPAISGEFTSPIHGVVMRHFTYGEMKMRQEDYNDMMRYPGEVKRAKPEKLPQCPRCGEHYSGDGLKLCVECEAEYVREMKDAFGEI